LAAVVLGSRENSLFAIMPGRLQMFRKRNGTGIGEGPLGLSAASPRGFSDFRSWTRLAQLKLYPVAETHRAFVLFQVRILRFATELHLGTELLSKILYEIT
jgi:hypothetical protein